VIDAGKAMQRIQAAYEIARGMGNKLVLAYSGGKDSDVLLDLAVKSGAPFEAAHNLTTVDAPETVYHVRDVFERLGRLGIPAKINRPETGMWDLIPKNQMPPTRLMRYCCTALKERQFAGEHILTGVRWAESASRKKRGVHEKLAKDAARRIVYYDENDDAQKLTNICVANNRVATNPIISWTDADVWEYIRGEGIKTNPLYGCGFRRVGCIGCPLGRKKNMLFEFQLFPKYKALYMAAFDRMLESRKSAGKTTRWENAGQVFDWWLGE